MLLMLCGFARKVAMLIGYNRFVLWCLSSYGGKGGNFRRHFFYDTLLPGPTSSLMMLVHWLKGLQPCWPLPAHRDSLAHQRGKQQLKGPY